MSLFLYVKFIIHNGIFIFDFFFGGGAILKSGSLQLEGTDEKWKGKTKNVKGLEQNWRGLTKAKGQNKQEAQGF